MCLKWSDGVGAEAETRPKSWAGPGDVGLVEAQGKRSVHKPQGGMLCVSVSVVLELPNMFMK